MRLTAASKLGPYETVSAIRAGGMSASGRGERAARDEPQRAGVPAFAKASARPPKLARMPASGGGRSASAEATHELNLARGQQRAELVEVWRQVQ